MKSRFPTPNNIGKYPSTFGSSYANFGHESPSVEQDSDTKEAVLPSVQPSPVESTQKEELYTFKKLFSQEPLVQLTKSHNKFKGIFSDRDILYMDQRHFRNANNKADDIAIMILSFIGSGVETNVDKAIYLVSQYLKNGNFGKLTQEAINRVTAYSQKLESSLKNGIIPDELLQPSFLLGKSEKEREDYTARMKTLPGLIHTTMPVEYETTAVPQVQATYDPQLLDDSQIADVADVTDTPATEVTLTPEDADSTFSVTIDGVAFTGTREELVALIQAGETLPTLVSENEKLKKEVEAAKKSASTSKYIAMALGIGLLAGGGYWYYTTTQQNQ